jgi:hypothetical protein
MSPFLPGRRRKHLGFRGNRVRQTRNPKWRPIVAADFCIQHHPQTDLVSYGAVARDVVLDLDGVGVSRARTGHDSQRLCNDHVANLPLAGP